MIENYLESAKVVKEMKIEVDKELYITMKCLIVALMHKYCPDNEFVLTKEQRKKLIGLFSVNVQEEVLDNLDSVYYLTCCGEKFVEGD